jgi:hypothetical protein
MMTPRIAMRLPARTTAGAHINAVEAPMRQLRRVTIDGSPRLLNVIACRYLQGRGQLNVGRKPAYVSTRPLGPLPAAVRTDEPSARTRILQFRPRTCGIEHGFRSKGSALAGIRQPVKNATSTDGNGACAQPGRPSIQATSGRANAGTSLHGTPADVSSGPPSEATLVLFFLDIRNPSIGLTEEG